MLIFYIHACYKHLIIFDQLLQGKYCIHTNCLLVPTVGPGMCPAGDDKVWKIHWPATAQGSIQSVYCAIGMAQRRCGDGGAWGSVDATECESQTVRTVRMEVRT